MLTYMRKNLPDEYGILLLQDRILEIMVYIDEFCEENGIDYCLMAGSALGARRHKGFIPWDDDMDIYMTEDCYEKFRKMFGSKGDKSKYYLQEWGTVDYKGKHMITMAKIRMNGTVLNEKTYEKWSIHKGIFVDIFILHNCASDLKTQKKQYYWTEAVVLKGLETRGYLPKNRKDKLILTVSKLMPRQWILKHGLSYSYRYSTEQTNFFHGFVDTRKFSRAVFSKDVMFPTKYVDFETVKLKVPAKNDDYLRIQFGDDFMTPPPIEKRPINKHTVGWGYENIPCTAHYSDEWKLI